MKIRFRVPALACFALLGLLGAAKAQDAPPTNPRIALVIGEATYLDGALPTAANDAGLIAQVLQAAGFDVVGARDLDEKSVRGALRDFLDKAAQAGPNMQAFVYLGGRALQYEGDNYFVPIDARIDRDSDAPIEAIRLGDFTHALAAAPGLARIVVIDGARANPYAAKSKPLAGGLALVEPEQGELIAFNAAPGSIGADEQGPYGVYAKTLAGAMRQGGVSVEDVFAQTRIGVNQATGGAQLPWSAAKLSAPYYIFERSADAPPPPPPVTASNKPLRDYGPDQAYDVALQRDSLPAYEEFLVDYPNSAQARRVRAILAARREARFWQHTRELNTPRSYWTYMRRYPKGPHVADAQRRLEILSARLAPPVDFAPEDYADLPPPPPDEMIYADRPVYVFDGPDYGPPPMRAPEGFYAHDDDDWRDLPPPPPSREFGVLPALAIAIPLIIGARAYHDAGRRDGHAPKGAPPPVAPPVAPPPLPPGVHIHPVGPKPVIPAAPGATPTPGAAKPLVPAPVGGQPLPTPTPAPLGGKGAGQAPAQPIATPAPGAAKPLVPAPVGGQPLPTPTPASTGLKPGAVKPLANPAPLGAQPSPTPLPTPGGGKANTPTALKPTPAPLAAPVKTIAPVVTPTPLKTAPAAPGTVIHETAPPKRMDAPPRVIHEAAPAPAPVKMVAPPAPAKIVAPPPAPAPVHMAAPPAPAPVHMAPPPAPAPVHMAPPPAPPPVRMAPPPTPTATRAAPPPPAPGAKCQGQGCPK